MTVAAALAEGRRCLAGFSATPELDAEVLLAHLLNGSRSSLIAAGRDPLDAQTCQRFDQLIQRRKQGEPVAYLTGEKEFWSLMLKVTPDVLVPRPETELLVEWVLEIIDSARPHSGTSSFPVSRGVSGTASGGSSPANDRGWGPGHRRRESSLSIVDLGTGSGAIALALAKELPESFVTATDSCAKALALALDNAKCNGIANIAFLQSCWLKGLDSRLRGNDGGFDFIVSNPPYIAENDPHLADLRFEPPAALTAGPDGLSALRQITAEAGKFLKPAGWLLLEHGAEQGGAVRGLFKAAGFGQIETRRDLAGLERATAGQTE